MMNDTKIKREDFPNIVESYPFVYAVGLCIVSAIIAIVLLILFMVQTAGNNSERVDYRKHTNWNLMADSFANDTNQLQNPSPGYNLINDLYDFEKAEKSSNPFSPESVEEVIVGSGTYSGIDNQMGCIFPVTTTECEDSGGFSSEFLVMYNSLRSGSPADLYYKDVKRTDLGLHLFPFDMSWWKFFGGIWVLTWIPMLIFMGVSQPERSGWRYENVVERKDWDIGFLNWLFGFILFPPAYLFIGIASIKNSANIRNTAKRIEKEKLEKIQNHPLHAQLLIAEQKLINIQQLAMVYPQDKDIAKNAKDCLAFVEELRTFPDKLSAKSAKYLSKEIRSDIEDLSSVATTRLDSYDEIQKL